MLRISDFLRSGRISCFGFRIYTTMHVEQLPISQLLEDPSNARRHPQRNLDQIKASLRRFGQQKPIVVDATNIVRAGNGTLAAAKALGWTTIAAVRSDLVKTELTAYAIADNRTAELAEWDQQILAETLADIEIGDVGFGADEIANLKGIESEIIKDPAEAELPPEKWMIVVTCENESHQAELLERFAAQGISCKALLG